MADVSKKLLPVIKNLQKENKSLKATIEGIEEKEEVEEEKKDFQEVLNEIKERFEKSEKDHWALHEEVIAFQRDYWKTQSRVIDLEEKQGKAGTKEEDCLMGGYIVTKEQEKELEKEIPEAINVLIDLIRTKAQLEKLTNDNDKS